MTESLSSDRIFRLPLVPRRGLSVHFDETPAATRRRRYTRSASKERALANGSMRERDTTVKPFSVEPGAEIGDPSFTDLIACERDCRNCSYAAWLDCDGNCGECVHNGYCPCVNPVVARSKTALKIIELRPLLLQDLRSRR